MKPTPKPKGNKQYLPRNKKYIDFLPALKSDADIILIPTNKGAGKTYQAFRQAFIAYGKNGLPSAYIRSTLEQLKEFTAEDKFGEMLLDLGWDIKKNQKITTKGFYRLKNKSKNQPNRINEPIIYFGSVNQAMTIQSSKFKKLNLVIVDEVQHHFRKTGENTVNQLINLISSMIRDVDAPIWIIFNQVDENDILLQKFKVNKIISKVPQGHIRKFKRTFDDGDGGFAELKIAIFKPLQSKELKESKKKSVSNRLSFITDYGKVINSNEFYITKAKIKYIKTLGDFKGIINANGFEIGFWMKKDGTYQFTDKYNKTGKTKYFSYSDYVLDGGIGGFNFIKSIKKEIIQNNVEFESQEIFARIIDLIKVKAML